VKFSWSRFLCYFFLLCYFLFLLKLLIFREPISVIAKNLDNYNIALFKKSYAHANFIPIKTLYYYLSMNEPAEVATENIAGNILIFLPYGFLLALAFEKLRSWKRLLLAVFLSSLFFELTQLLFYLGNFDVDDILLNSLGGLLGYCCFLPIHQIIKKEGALRNH
jgi:glycopeptide antibiotics resistance protein